MAYEVKRGTGKFDAFVLAGDKGKRYRPIHGMNKAFLTLEGKPMFLHVLSALDRVRDVAHIYIIGPRQAILTALRGCDCTFTKSIEVLEQRENLLENIIYGYAYSLGYQEGSGNFADSDRLALFVPDDVPLLTTSELEEFIAKADMTRYDYCVGMTPEEHLIPFYPTRDRPGIKMAYLYLRDRVYRINNLHIVRPSRIGAAGYIQKMYDYRYQRSLQNRLRIAYELIKATPRTIGILLFLLAHGAVFFSCLKWSSVAKLFRHQLSVENIEISISTLLMTRFKIVQTSIGGGALDVDDESAYAVLSQRFGEWRDHLATATKVGTHSTNTSS